MAKKIYGYFLEKENIKGITESWPECQKITSGKKARYMSFDTIEECKAWLDAGAIYETRAEKKEKNAALLPDGIYFDAGTGRGTGVEVRVTDKHGISLIKGDYYSFKLNEYGNISLGHERTNNFGELLGLSIAISYANAIGIHSIFGDSKLVLEYWSKGIYKAAELPADTVKLIKYTTNQRKKFEAAEGKIDHISGDVNPADIGFHK